jgi:amidohydrolase
VIFKEFRTADKVTAYLEDIGLEVHRITETGVIGLLKGDQPGPTLMMRADMDALPIQEANDVPYKSVHDGKMHACGHDGHTAMLLVAAKVLTQYKKSIRGTIKFLFQPNEEDLYADVLVEKGVLENPHVDAAVGIHLMSSLPTGTIGISSGAVMAGMHAFRLTVTGKGGHTGFPQDSIDPILTSASIIQAVQAVQTRESDIFKPTSIIFGKIGGGTVYNAIADEVEMEGTIRYLYDIESNPALSPIDKFERYIKRICDAYRAKYQLNILYSHPAVINGKDMTARVAEAAKETVEAKNIVPFVTMIGEDFCHFANKVPSTFYFVGTGNPKKNTDFPHHHSCFDLDEDALAIGVETNVRTALSFLS